MKKIYLDVVQKNILPPWASFVYKKSERLQTY